LRFITDAGSARSRAPVVTVRGREKPRHRGPWRGRQERIALCFQRGETERASAHRSDTVVWRHASFTWIELGRRKLGKEAFGLPKDRAAPASSALAQVDQQPRSRRKLKSHYDRLPILLVRKAARNERDFGSIERPRPSCSLLRITIRGGDDAAVIGAFGWPTNLVEVPCPAISARNMRAVSVIPAPSGEH
jgi:hypothetical protein